MDKERLKGHMFTDEYLNDSYNTFVKFVYLKENFIKLQIYM